VVYVTDLTYQWICKYLFFSSGLLLAKLGGGLGGGLLWGASTPIFVSW
jgi:hypothetical protein